MAQSQHPEFGQNRFSIALVDGLKNIVDPGVYSGFKVVVVTATFDIEIRNLGVVGRAKTTSGVTIEDNDTSSALDTISVIPTPNLGETRIIVAVMRYAHLLSAVATYELVYGAQTAGVPVKPVIPTDAIELASWELPETAADMDDAVNFTNVLESNVAGQPLAPADATNISDILLTGADGGSEDKWSRSDHSHNHNNLSAVPTGSPHDLGQIGVAPTTAGDWVAPPTDAQLALDELAARLTTAVAPEDIGVAAAAGTSKEAARADHEHDHGDLTGNVATHHDTVQSVHTQANPAAWATPDGGTVKAHLDELAGVGAASVLYETTGLSIEWGSTIDQAVVKEGLSVVLYDEMAGVPGISATPTLALGARYTADLTLDKTTATSALGRDVAGAFSIDTWVGLFAIGDTSGVASPSFIFSQDFTNGPTLPGTYDVFRLLSMGRNDGSGELIPSRKIGKTTMYLDEQLVFSGAPPISTMDGITTSEFMPTEDLGDLIGHYGANGGSGSNQVSTMWLAHGSKIGATNEGYIALRSFANFSGSMAVGNALSVPTRGGAADNIAKSRNNGVAFTGADVLVQGWDDNIV